LIVLAGLLVAGGLVAGGYILGSDRNFVTAIVDRRVEVQVPYATRLHSFNQMPEQGMPEILPRQAPGFTPRDFIEPMTMDQAREAIDDYLKTLDIDGLEIGEIILFDNHAYATILESETAAAAFEVRVMPGGMGVFVEPNSWNLKYSGDAVGKRGLRGTIVLNPEEVPAMTVTPEQALSFAQAYLDEYLPEAALSGDPIAFPGYYTLRASSDGEVNAILHVNGYTGQTYADRWRGEFVEMSE
jgi:hypothetical protein